MIGLPLLYARAFSCRFLLYSLSHASGSFLEISWRDCCIPAQISQMAVHPHWVVLHLFGRCIVNDLAQGKVDIFGAMLEMLR